VFGSDITVLQTIGFLGGEVQHSFNLGAERNLNRRRDRFLDDGSGLDLLTEAFHRYPAGERLRRQAPAFADQSEQQVLGFHRS